MKNFKDFDLQISYKNVGESNFSSIINPLLSCTKLYRRSVGFFSSSALDFITDGVITLARNGGRIMLATSPKLTEEDKEAIKIGYELRSIAEERFLKEFEEAISNITSENAKILSSLIAEGVVDIKIVFKNKGMYHDKLAVLTDFEGNEIAFVGSSNETGPGYDSNYEKVRTFKSWFDAEGRIKDETDEFLSIWNNNADELQVYDFEDAIQNKLFEKVVNESGDANSRSNKKNDDRQYQIDAKNNWIANGHKGFFVMATGTGKTYTSLFSIKEFIEENKIFTVIAVPYKHLVEQWKEEALSIIPNAKICCVYGELTNADEDVLTSYINSKIQYKPVIVITTINSFFLNKYQNLYKQVLFKKLLIVDEAHNFINCLSDELSVEYPYKLGLSATPVFGKDKQKTEKLLNWFGGKVIDYPIEKAIHNKYLVEYYYHPIFVNATDHDESEFGKYTKIMISAMDPVTGTIVDEERFAIGYRGRLKTIALAEEKMKNIKNIFYQINGNDHTIIYCSDGKVTFNNDSVSEIRHLEYILKIINNAIITTNPNLRASKFTATENVSRRMELINDFNTGTINYLVAIKCLDEGINIPSIKNALILSSNDNYREFVQRRGRILRNYKNPIDGSKKDVANIYDVIVLPSYLNRPFAIIEFRRFYEYCRVAKNKKELIPLLFSKLAEYAISLDEIMYDNDHAYGGDLDD